MNNNKKEKEYSLLEKVSILFVEDDPDVSRIILKFLQMYFNRIYTAFDGEEGLEVFNRHNPDVVITDIRMPIMDGLQMAEKIKAISPNTPIIIITAFSETELLMKAIEIGVDKYVRKPADGDKLLEAIYNSALPLIQKQEIETLNEKLYISLENRISKSKCMKDVIKQIQKVAHSDFSIIIYGETGVGKSYTARIIHDMSRRIDKPFVTVDIGTIPETLVESELFGHTKGAFTGADRNKKGFFEIANGGTLFLEDLENINAYVQSKLLRAVEEKRIIPVGSTKPIKVDIRIIGATNKDIQEEIKQKRFREDLFYRLCEFDIHLMALRDRPEDIPLLAEKFVNEVAAELEKNIIEISGEAIDMLMNHPWPGNIRELKNVLRRAVLVCETNRISSKELSDALRIGKKKEGLQPFLVDSTGFELATAVKQTEQQIIQRALKKTKGKKVKAASLLNIDYKTLVGKMEKYKIT